MENHIGFGNEGFANDELLPRLTHGFHGTEVGNIPPKGTEITAQIARRTTTSLSRTLVVITKKRTHQEAQKTDTPGNLGIQEAQNNEHIRVRFWESLETRKICINFDNTGSRRLERWGKWTCPTGASGLAPLGQVGLGGT